MKRRLTEISVIILGILIGVLTNVATGVLPEMLPTAWRQYLWLAWLPHGPPAAAPRHEPAARPSEYAQRRWLLGSPGHPRAGDDRSRRTVIRLALAAA